MANVSKTVEIVFGGKDDLSKVIDQIGRKFDDLGGLTDKITEPLAKVGKSILEIDAALMALAIGGLAYAIKESSSFNKSFALISTSITATGDDLAKYRTDILNYSTTSVKSLEEINASLYTAAQAGVKYADSIGFIRKAEELAVANNANLNTTVDLLTGTMNSYGYTLKDVARLNDIFFTSTLIGKQTIDDLGQSMGQVVGIAANSGVSFEELSAAIATLTAKGLKTEEAITAVKGVITTIIAPSKEAATAAKELGLNFSLTELSTKGFSAMLTEIMAKTGGSKEKMVDLFNEVRAMNGALMLTGDGMKFFGTALDQIKNSTGSAEEAYAKMVATFSNQSQMMINVARTTMVDIGTQIEPSAARVAGALAGLFTGIKIGVEAGAFDPLFAYLDQVAGSLATWFNGIATAMPEAFSKLNFAGLIAAFTDLGRAINDYFGGMDLTQADDLAGVMQLLIDMVTGIVRVSTGMADAFRPFATVILDFFTTLAAGGPETQATMGQILAFSQAIQSAGLGVVAAILAINEFQVSMRGIFEVIAGGASLVANGLKTTLLLIMDWILQLEGAIVQTINTLTGGMFPGLGALQEQIGQQITAGRDAIEKSGLSAADALSKMGDGFVRLGTETGVSRDRAEELRKKLTEIPAVTAPEIKITGVAETAKTVEEISVALETIPEKLQTTVEVLADGSTIERAAGMIKQTFPDGQVVWTNIGLKTDGASIDAAKSKLDKAAPDKKEIEVQLKLDEIKLKEKSDIIQKSIEWKAKIDIANIEANTKIMEATFKSLDNTITNTGATMSSLAGTYASMQTAGKGGTSVIEQLMSDENKRREETLTLQKQLTTAEIDNVKKRNDAMDRGESTITINGAGLQPHLEAFMFTILEAIQVRANAEGQKFLVGV